MNCVQAELDFTAPVVIVPARARSTDPDTSHDAADSFSEHKLSELQGAVLAWFQKHRRGTDEQLENSTEFANLAPSTARKRRTDLAERGLIRDSGERAINSRNRKMVVWELAEATP